MKKVLFPLIAIALVFGLILMIVGPANAAFVGSLEILKQDQDGNALFGATFVISPDPQDLEGGLTVVDNGMNDDDSEKGVLLVTSCLLGQEYTVTETVAPPGYEAAPPQSVILTLEITTVTLTFVDHQPGVGGNAQPINKVGVLAPWISLALLLIGGTTWFALRRRSD